MASTNLSSRRAFFVGADAGAAEAGFIQTNWSPISAAVSSRLKLMRPMTIGTDTMAIGVSFSHDIHAVFVAQDSIDVASSLHHHDATAVSSSTGKSTSGLTRKALDSRATVPHEGEVIRPFSSCEMVDCGTPDVAASSSWVSCRLRRSSLNVMCIFISTLLY